jgi:hypothetical protein
MCRVAIQGRHVCFLKSNAATRPRQSNGFLQKPFRIPNGGCHTARKHEIEAPGWKPGAVGITRHKFDVHQTVRLRVLASMVEKDSIHVEADDSPGRANTHAEQIRYAARTTAQIKACHPRSHTDAVQILRSPLAIICAHGR